MITFPVWLLAQLSRPFYPESHPWKHNFYNAAEFKKQATPDCRILGLLIWVQGAFTLAMYGMI